MQVNLLQDLKPIDSMQGTIDSRQGTFIRDPLVTWDPVKSLKLLVSLLFMFIVVSLLVLTVFAILAIGSVGPSRFI